MKQRRSRSCRGFKSWYGGEAGRTEKNSQHEGADTCQPESDPGLVDIFKSTQERIPGDGEPLMRKVEGWKVTLGDETAE